jgi:hypothetical protein
MTVLSRYWHIQGSLPDLFVAFYEPDPAAR